MVNDPTISRPSGDVDASLDHRRPGELARVRLVNRGRDTQITLGDGSTIVLKGIRQVDAVFPDKFA
jgi:hypothetical protein